MPVERRVFRRRPVTLTSLIDIIFLLLLFFMLSSTFTRFSELPLMTAAGGAAPDGPQPVFVQLGVAGLRLNGQAVSLDALPEALSRFEVDGATVPVVVTLDAELTSQELVDLLVALRAEPWLAVAVLG